MSKNVKISINAEQARACIHYMPELKDEFLKYFSEKELRLDTFPYNVYDIKLSGYVLTENSSIHKSSTEESGICVPFPEDALKMKAEARLRCVAFICNNEKDSRWVEKTSIKYHSVYDFYSKNVMILESTHIITGGIYFKEKKHLQLSLAHHHEIWCDYFGVDYFDPF